MRWWSSPAISETGVAERAGVPIPPGVAVQAGCRGARLTVREEADVAIARKCVRHFAPLAALSASATHAMEIAVSEVARNIVVHAGVGELTFDVAAAECRQGLVVVAADRGPGIADVPQALQDGYSTSGTLGLGLSSARRLVDEFDIVSAVSQGTAVTLRMWGR